MSDGVRSAATWMIVNDDIVPLARRRIRYQRMPPTGCPPQPSNQLLVPIECKTSHSSPSNRGPPTNLPDRGNELEVLQPNIAARVEERRQLASVRIFGLSSRGFPRVARPTTQGQVVQFVLS